nr:hypothetical protein [Tanacetum cinerariifolium]
MLAATFSGRHTACKGMLETEVVSDQDYSYNKRGKNMTIRNLCYCKYSIFFFNGNSQNEQQQGKTISRGRGQQGGSQQKGSNTIFQGFSVEFLAPAFNIDQETAQRLSWVERGLWFVSPIVILKQQGQ